MRDRGGELGCGGVHLGAFGSGGGSEPGGELGGRLGFRVLGFRV